MRNATDSETWRRVKEILDAIDRRPDDRELLIEQACAGDLDLRVEVESFLVHEDAAGTFLDRPLWRALPGDGQGEAGRAEARPPLERRRIGPYRLERLLGKGGMGEVYLATREDDYEQKVALKRTLAPGLRAEAVERFVTERQILADLQHPGIARLLDGGTDEEGVPFLVMEYVEGVPIDEYCDQSSLTLRQRVRLVSKVCRIVHHAHKRLVVHRDLKPSNILVTPDGQPRLLDFGIAKLLATDAAATVEGLAMMTPSCASPEQLMGEAITTSCDVYGLGVLLYRLLALEPPYHLDGLHYAAICRVVCLQEVEKPSVAALGQQEIPRHPDSAIIAIGDALPPPEIRRRRLVRQLRGELDAIVMKALRKEPEHRYASAAELADDLDRYLESLPVVARKGNWFYHAGKHLRRNKPVVALLVLILVLAVTASLFAVKAERARRAAVEARDGSESLKNFLIDILQSPAPDEAKGRDRTVREVVEQARPKIERDLAGRLPLQAEMLDILGEVFNELGDHGRALELHEKALETEREHDPTPHSVLADYIANVGSAHYAMGNFVEAEASYGKALEMREGLGVAGLDLAQTLLNLIHARMQRGEVEGVGEGLRRILDIRRDHGAEDIEIAESLYSLGAWSLKQGDAKEAAARLEEGLAIRRRVEGETSLGASDIAKTLARAYHDLGRLEEARELYDHALATWTLLFGTEHARVHGLEPHVARLLLDLGELDAGIELASRAASALGEELPASHPRLVVARSVWAAGRLRRGLEPGTEARDAEELVLAGYRLLAERQGERSFLARWTARQLEGRGGVTEVPPAEP